MNPGALLVHTGQAWNDGRGHSKTSYFTPELARRAGRLVLWSLFAHGVQYSLQRCLCTRIFVTPELGSLAATTQHILMCLALTVLEKFLQITRAVSRSTGLSVAITCCAATLGCCCSPRQQQLCWYGPQHTGHQALIHLRRDTRLAALQTRTACLLLSFCTRQEQMFGTGGAVEVAAQRGAAAAVGDCL